MNIETSKRRMRKLSKILTNKNAENRILSQHLQISDNKSPNTLLIGSHGLDYSVIKPNIIKKNSSFVIFDAGGYLLKDMSPILKNQGYQIRVLDLDNGAGQYNPFQYIRKESDIEPLVQCIMDGTKELDSGDGFIEDCETFFLRMIFCYSWKVELNMDQTINLIGKEAYAAENNIVTRFQKHIEKLEEIHGSEYIVVRQYRSFMNYCGSIHARKKIILNAFERIQSLNGILVFFSQDTIKLSDLAKKEKQAIFCITPKAHKTFHFAAAMFYTQVCQELLYQADLHGGILPFPVTIMFQADEFLLKSEFWPNYFNQSYRNNINNFIHAHSLDRLKQTFGNKWELIFATCDSIVFHDRLQEADERYIKNYFRLDEKVNWSDEKCLIYIRKHGFFVDDKFDPRKLKR